MTHSTYHFKTTFSLAAPTRDVWNVIADYSSWVQWWKPLKRLDIVSAAFPQIIVITIGPFFYRLTFTLRVTSTDEYTKTEFVSTGDLAGIGSFAYSHVDDITSVVFAWNVSTTKSWMNATQGVLRPLFVWSHDMVMTAFAHGIARYMEVKLVSVHHDVT